MKKTLQKKHKRESFRLELSTVNALRLVALPMDRGNKSQFVRRTVAEALLRLLPSFNDAWSTEELQERITLARRNVLLLDQPDYCALTKDLPSRAAYWLKTFDTAIAELAEDPQCKDARRNYGIVLENCPEELL